MAPAPAAPVQTSAPAVQPQAAATKKVVTTQVVTTEPVAVKSQPAVAPQPKANVQQPVVVQPVVVQPVVLQPKAIEPAPAVASAKNTEEAVTRDSNVNTKSEDANKNVKVKKNKDGTNVYNFNFYNSKKEPAPKVKTPEVTTAASLPKPKKSPIRGGSGPQVELFFSGFTSSDDDSVDSSSGTKLSYRIMHKETGFYVAPGYIKGSVESYFNSGDSSGFLVRIGRMSNDYRRFYLDYGIEYSKVEGEYDHEDEFWFGGNSRGDFEMNSLSLYLSPSLRWGSFGIAWPIQFGTTEYDGLAADRIETYSIANGWVSSHENVRSVSDSSTFFTLGMSMSLYF